MELTYLPENNILEFKMMEFELLKKHKKGNEYSQNQYKYLKWFIDNSKFFNEVDVNLSHTVSRDNQCRVKSCYHNCWKAVSCGNLKNLRYFEGFVYSKRVPIPLEHSWLVSPEGLVVDPTLIISGDTAWEQLKEDYHMTEKDKRLTHDLKRYGDQYYGVEFDLQFLNKLVFKHKKTGGFLIELFLSKGQELYVKNG